MIEDEEEGTVSALRFFADLIDQGAVRLEPTSMFLRDVANELEKAELEIENLRATLKATTTKE